VAETPAGIPNRAWFRASEVCGLAGIQPYVLRSWEAEFTSLGVSRGPGKPRLYRREDVDLVLRIRRLVLDEGLTLAGVRRRIEDALAPDAESVSLAEVLGPEIRARLSEIRHELRALLEMLSPAGETAAGLPPAESSESSAASPVPEPGALLAEPAGTGELGPTVVEGLSEPEPAPAKRRARRPRKASAANARE